eukprot:gene32650-39031_t
MRLLPLLLLLSSIQTGRASPEESAGGTLYPVTMPGADLPPNHWMRSMKEHNKEMHALNGNTTSFRPGDYRCPGCGAHNYSRRKDCYRCGTPRPQDGRGPPPVQVAQVPTAVPWMQPPPQPPGVGWAAPTPTPALPAWQQIPGCNPASWDPAAVQMPQWMRQQAPQQVRPPRPENPRSRSHPRQGGWQTVGHRSRSRGGRKADTRPRSKGPRQNRSRSRSKGRQHKGPQSEQERREDPTVKSGGKRYSFHQFVEFYGPKEGRNKWVQGGRAARKRGLNRKDGEDPHEPRPDADRGNKRFPYEDFRERYPDDFKKRWKKAGQMLKRMKTDDTTPPGVADDWERRKKHKKHKKDSKGKGKGRGRGGRGNGGKGLEPPFPAAHYATQHSTPDEAAAKLRPAIVAAKQDVATAEREEQRLRSIHDNKARQLKKLEGKVEKLKVEGAQVLDQLKEAGEKLEGYRQTLQDEELEARIVEDYGGNMDGSTTEMEEDDCASPKCGDEKPKPAKKPAKPSKAAAAATAADKATAEARREATKMESKVEEMRKQLEEAQAQIALERSAKEAALQAAESERTLKEAHANDAAAQRAAATAAPAAAAAPAQAPAADAPPGRGGKSPPRARPPVADIPSPGKLEQETDEALEQMVKKYGLAQVGAKPATGRSGPLAGWRRAAASALSALRPSKEKRSDSRLEEVPAAKRQPAGNGPAATASGGAVAAGCGLLGVRVGEAKNPGPAKKKGVNPAPKQGEKKGAKPAPKQAGKRRPTAAELARRQRLDRECAAAKERQRRDREEMLITGGEEVTGSVAIWAEARVLEALPKAEWGVVSKPPKTGAPNLANDNPLFKRLFPGIQVQKAKISCLNARTKEQMDKGTLAIGKREYVTIAINAELKGQSPFGAALTAELLAVLPPDCAVRITYRKEWGAHNGAREMDRGLARDVQKRLVERRKNFVERGGGVSRVGKLWRATTVQDQRDEKRAEWER